MGRPEEVSALSDAAPRSTTWSNGGRRVGPQQGAALVFVRYTLTIGVMVECMIRGVVIGRHGRDFAPW
ncbi:MAG TPA: hypothetical protein VMM27_13275 [Casimicrobiaceae bacterium]|nr:hypothetical protein [Casimicrobiaceae bacterium]